MVVRDNTLYTELAKKLKAYSDEPSDYKRQRMLLSVDGKLGAMRKNGDARGAIAVEELRKIIRRLK